MATSSSPSSNSSSRYEATHDRILEVASRALRLQGYAGVGVADVMKQAGLTHGGFYAHFPSRDALLVEAMGRAGADSAAVMSERIATRAPGTSELRAIVEHYLSDSHLASAEYGCAVAALASEMPRQSESVAAASCARVRALVGRVEHALPAGRATEAFQIVATMVGSLQLARALGHPAQARAMLAATRADLLARFDRENVPAIPKARR
jgi:TetR/AcrR family transcriptional regulator, transcriptional repressor for nem operon